MINIAFSGGKDSTAMLLRMIELNEQIDNIYFANTGLEYPEMYKYIKMIEKHINRKITFVQPNTSFWHWFYGNWTRGNKTNEIRGFPMVLTHGFCCRELKVKPLEKLKQKGDITCLGICIDEGWRVQNDKNLRYPLIEWKWTEDHCNYYLKEKKLENPLYKRLSRTGCWLCPKQSIESLHYLYDNYPLLWNHLKKLEKLSPHGFHHQRKLIDFENKWKNQFKLEG
jgi:3'-phosphoadenosine 5'-phosphosulfate sulfotransferase (PAPS reductase)/FAD synthetase